MNDNLITTSQELIPIRPVKPKKQLCQASLSGKRKDGAPKQIKISPRMRKFCDYIEEGKSSRKAALLANYSPSMADIASVKLLQHPLIAAELRRRSQESAKLREIDPEMIYDGLAKIINANPLDYGEINSDGKFVFNLAQISRDQGYAIQEISYDADGRLKIRFADKLAAKALWGKFKRMGVLAGESSGNGEDGQPLTIQDFDAIIQKVTINQTTINNNLIQHNRSPQIEAGDAIQARQ